MRDAGCMTRPAPGLSAMTPPAIRPMIRPARAADLPACARIINAYIDATDWLPRVRSAEDIAACFTPEILAKRAFFVAEMDGAIMGYASIDRESGFLHALYLRPEGRGIGLGRALLDHIKSVAARFDLTVFEPNHAAMRFYLREGLAELADGRRTDTPEGVATRALRWDVRAARARG